MPSAAPPTTRGLLLGLITSAILLLAVATPVASSDATGIESASMTFLSAGAHSAAKAISTDAPGPQTGPAEGRAAVSTVTAAPLEAAATEEIDDEVTPDELLAHAEADTGVVATQAAVAVFDPTSGKIAAWGETEPQITASIVKVDILVTLLLQCQDAGRTLTAGEQQLAAVMITESDNDAASELWNAIGQADGLAEANQRLGLTSTTPGEGDYWGLTTTTPLDQVRLLSALVSTASPVSAEHRSYILQLMTQVDPDQAWGVSSGGTAALKNGWLDRPDGTWAINSIGIVTSADNRQLIIAVQSHGWDSMEAGVAAVEHLATAATSFAI